MNSLTKTENQPDKKSFRKPLKPLKKTKMNQTNRTNEVVFFICLIGTIGACSREVKEGTGAENITETTQGNETDNKETNSSIPTTSNSPTTSSDNSTSNTTINLTSDNSSTSGIKSETSGNIFETSSETGLETSSGENIPICGNNIPEIGEECDEGPNGSNKCNVDCTLIICGNGIIEGIEECDDGNMEDIDRCNNDCKLSRFIFLSSDYIGGSGGFGSLEIADNFCQNDANKFGLNGIYKAWLNDSNDNLIDLLNSELFEDWYLLPTNNDTYFEVAQGWNGLTSGTLLHAIDTIANGSKPPESAMVWTNTRIDGHIYASDTSCGNWTVKDPTNKGRVGVSNSVAMQWTDVGEIGCNMGAKLYCIQIAN